MIDEPGVIHVAGPEMFRVIVAWHEPRYDWVWVAVASLWHAV